MPIFNKANPSDYPIHILQSFSYKAIIDFSRSALQNKNYSELKFLAANTDQASSIIHNVINSLDIKAVQAVLEGSKINKDSYIRKGSHINEYLIKDLLDDDFSLDMSAEEVKSNKSAILKILLEEKPVEDLTLSELQRLVNILPQQDFENFCASKEIDLTSEKFEKLEIPYFTNELTPAIVLDEEANNLVDFILSHSFADKLSASELKKIYIDLYDLHPIAKEMMVLMGTLISQNNSLKIIFAENSNSHYNPTHNIIRIDSNFKDETIFNIQSVLIHEIGHYINDQINDKFSPFNLESIKNLIREIYSDYRESIEDFNMRATLNYKLYKNETFKEYYKETVDPFFKMIEEYELSARKPIDKAAELLHVNTTDYDKYLFTEEYTEWFKENSFIDLFHLNGAAGFRVENSNATSDFKTPDHIFLNIFNIYQNEQNTCESNPLQPTQKEEIVKWATEEFLPQMVKEFDLSPKEIHYLDRIGDYINRGKHRLDDSNHYHYRHSSSINLDSEKYVELIVRAMEFRAAELGEDLTSPFNGLESFHIKFLSPAIQKLISNNTLPFYDVSVDENLSCNNSTDVSYVDNNCSNYTNVSYCDYTDIPT